MRIRIFDYRKDSFSPSLSLPRGEIHIWKIDCDRCAPSETLSQLLPPKERKQWEHYRKPLDRTHYLLGHGITRTLLHAYTGFPASEIIFLRGAHGKPHWESPGDIPPIEFSISHSGRWVLLAFSRDCLLGIDVEERRDSPHLNTLARRLLHPYEWRQYQALSPGDQNSFFYARWTAKEALLKGIGTGLSHSTDVFYIEETPSAFSENLFAVGSKEDIFTGWQITFLPISKNYSAALAFKA